jgi:hypothetical protein
MAKAAKKVQKPRLERAATYLRNRSDRERQLYVRLRKTVAPRSVADRVRAARDAHGSGGLEIPRDRGFVLCEPGQFPEADEVVADAQRRYEQLGDVAARSKGRKQFMIPVVQPEELDRQSPLIRLLMREDILSAVSAYLGAAPLINSANVYVSKPSDREHMSSQLLHCDADDTTQIKVFVLCNRVTEGNGPLMIMDAERSAQLRDTVDYQYRNRVSDEEARAQLGDLAMRALTGEPGTVALVDTSRCFHYGSRVGEGAGNRLAAMAQYLTPYSFMVGRKVDERAPFSHLAEADESRLARLALGA